MAPYGDTFLAEVGKVAKRYRVRFLAGTFGKELAEVYNVCSLGGPSLQGFAFCQPWWVGNAACAAPCAAVAADDAVVARFGSMPERDVCQYAACPFYLIVFLPWKVVDFPRATQTQEVPQWLSDDDFFSEHLVPLRFVPSSQADQAAALEAAVAAQHEGQPVCLGTLKQKKYNNHWDLLHIHQVIVWVGASRTGKRAREQYKEKLENKRRKAAVAATP